MRLNRTERWILANQHRILEKLYPDEADSLSEMREALEKGYELHYPPDYIYKDIVTEDECREVLDILEMFSVLKRDYEALSKEDRDGIDEWRVKFAGFDGNYETKQMAYARYFCGLDDGRYQELDRGDDFNSHMPTLDRYRAMVGEWKGSANKYELTKEDIIRITSLWKKLAEEQG